MSVRLEPGATLEGLDLSEADWTDADLTDAVLKDCTVRDAQLSGVILQGARLTGCRLVRCRLAHADLRETVLEGCGFADDEGHAGVQFAFSQLDEARFSKCDLSFAKLDRSSAYAIAMSDCNLRGAVFEKVDFARGFGPKVVRWAAAFTGCNLELADLAEGRLPGCDLSKSSFREADLRGADLEGADLTDCDLFQALTEGAKLAGADLRRAEVSGLDVTRLGSMAGLKITPDQQYRLLEAIGVDVQPD